MHGPQSVPVSAKPWKISAESSSNPSFVMLISRCPSCCMMLQQKRELLLYRILHTDFFRPCRCHVEKHVPLRLRVIRFVHEHGTVHCSCCCPTGLVLQVYKYMYRPAISLGDFKTLVQPLVNNKVDIPSFVHNGSRVVCISKPFKPRTVRVRPYTSPCRACGHMLIKDVNYCSVKCAVACDSRLTNVNIDETDETDESGIEGKKGSHEPGTGNLRPGTPDCYRVRARKLSVPRRSPI